MFHWLPVQRQGLTPCWKGQVTHMSPQPASRCPMFQGPAQLWVSIPASALLGPNPQEMSSFWPSWQPDEYLESVLNNQSKNLKVTLFPGGLVLIPTLRRTHFLPSIKQVDQSMQWVGSGCTWQPNPFQSLVLSLPSLLCAILLQGKSQMVGI